jgi:hypothetical protein
MGVKLTAIVMILVGLYQLIGVLTDSKWFWKGYKMRCALKQQGKKMARIVYIVSGIVWTIGGIVLFVKL